MQSAFVDICLDGDAFLYVSDVFENLEDYEHGHPSEQHISAPAVPATNGSTVELLPGESLARAAERHQEAPPEASHPRPSARHAAGAPAQARARASEEALQSAEQPASQRLVTP